MFILGGMICLSCWRFCRLIIEVGLYLTVTSWPSSFVFVKCFSFLSKKIMYGNFSVCWQLSSLSNELWLFWKKSTIKWWPQTDAHLIIIAMLYNYFDQILSMVNITDFLEQVAWTDVDVCQKTICHCYFCNNLKISHVTCSHLHVQFY